MHCFSYGSLVIIALGNIIGGLPGRHAAIGYRDTDPGSGHHRGVVVGVADRPDFVGGDAAVFGKGRQRRILPINTSYPERCAATSGLGFMIESSQLAEHL